MDEQDNYWRDRTIARLLKAEGKGVTALSKILPIYNQAQSNIDKAIQALYDNYSKKGLLDVSELKKSLSPTEQKVFLKKLEVKMRALGINPDDVFDQRYLSRLSRLEALKEQVRIEVMSIAPDEVKLSESTYSSIAKSSYAGMQGDMQTLGVNPAFSTLDTSIVNEMLRHQWYGGNYSSRIWGNTDELAQRLPIILGSALSSGQSYEKTARMLREEFEVSQYNASRLVRTESNFFHNQAELQSYIDDGIIDYDYDAVMDGKTSKICKRLNNKRFKVKDAVVGLNYPPMHGHCRSTTAPVFVGDEERVGTRAERVARYDLGPTNAQLKKQWAKKIKSDIVSKESSPVEALANKFKGNDLLDELQKLIMNTPKEDPTRPAIVKAAELYGWRYQKPVEKD